jgi:hypothetical protein
VLFAADDLNLHDRHADLFGDSPPFIARQRPWIHAVDDNSLANAAANERATSLAIVVLPTPGRPLRTIGMRSRQSSAGPGLDVVERYVPTDALKIPLVLGYEHATRLTTRQRQQDIVRE